MIQCDKKPVVLTCAQPTGSLHLGNYTGAIRNWKALQETHTCYFGIVDLHAMTIPYLPAELRRHSLECVAKYMACGIDPQKANIFIQSHVIGHTELAWILGCITPLGQLERMTQYKDKSQKAQAGIQAGLLYYPVLMAADILLYNADCVAIGADQKQHLELTRDLAQKFNERYSHTFTIPEVTLTTSGARLTSLQNPEIKMSKSDPNTQGTLFLFEPLSSIRKKIMGAITDSETSVLANPERKGIFNLLSIFHITTGQSLESLQQQYESSGYATFKTAVADAVCDYLDPIQKRFQSFMSDKAGLESILKAGAQAAQTAAYTTLAKVYRKVGLLERIR